MTIPVLTVPCLCAVTARRRLAPEARTTRGELQALGRFIDDLIGAGVDLIQVREVDLEDGPLVELVTAAVEASSGTRTRIIVNSRVDVAVTCRAAGVHLKDADPKSVPNIRSGAPALIVGRSFHDVPQESGDEPDYAVFGTVYPTTSKTGAPVTGLGGLAGAVGAFDCPVLAIGGITPERARLCVEVGAAGVAAIGAFLPIGRSPDALGPAGAVQAFREAFTRPRLDLLE